MLYKKKEPEWTPENINRVQGDTTFKTCGWCEHAGGGSSRYDCMLSTTCVLLYQYDEYNTDRNWDEPCIVMKLGHVDIETLIGHQRYEIESSMKSIDRNRKYISALEKLKEKLDDIPPTPSHRPHPYYDIKDIVYAYHEGEWRRGIVVKGYRHHDGCVSYILDGVSASRPGPEGTGPWGCGVGVPGILHEWEHRYFRIYPKKFDVWCTLLKEKYNQHKPDIEGMKKAFEYKG